MENSAIRGGYPTPYSKSHEKFPFFCGPLPEASNNFQQKWPNNNKKGYMSHCQMLGKFEYGLPAKI